MALRELQIHHLRNIQSATVLASPGINLIYGENGSGKTSLLEGIQLLGLARSFRAAKHNPLVKQGESELTVFGKLDTGSGGVESIGISKSRNGSTQLRCNGQTLSSAAELAPKLPVLSLTSNTFDLINGPPKFRRSLIDWLAFHVEPDFLDVWRRVQSGLKQRNSLLRRGKIDAFELEPWDRQLSVLAEKIDGIRRRIAILLATAFSVFEPLFPDLNAVDLSYQRGWNKELDYGQVLESQRDQDLLRGHTQTGPHRADLKISVAGGSAAELLSRGQQKLLVTALVLAQGRVYKEQIGRNCTYLIDDLPSEFDQRHRSKVAQWLESVDAQLFVTGIELEPLMDMWSQQVSPDSIRKFHVEHGRVQMLSS